MPDTRAALTMASDGGNTRFSISTDSMADVGALMVMVSWVQRKIGRYCRTRYLQATDAAYRQCRDAGTRLPQSDHARSLRPLTDDATLVSRHRSSVGLRWPSKRIAALHRLAIQLGMGCAMGLVPAQIHPRPATAPPAIDDLCQPMAATAAVPGPDPGAGSVRVPFLGRTGAPDRGRFRQHGSAAATGIEHWLQE